MNHEGTTSRQRPRVRMDDDGFRVPRNRLDESRSRTRGRDWRDEDRGRYRERDRLDSRHRYDDRRRDRRWERDYRPRAPYRSWNRDDRSVMEVPPYAAESRARSNEPENSVIEVRPDGARIQASTSQGDEERYWQETGSDRAARVSGWVANSGARSHSPTPRHQSTEGTPPRQVVMRSEPSESVMSLDPAAQQVRMEELRVEEEDPPREGARFDPFEGVESLVDWE